MKCPKCQIENPETKKFCYECGAKLLKICPQCGSEILPADKFCGECGHNLVLPSKPTPKDLSFDEKIRKIQKYLPRGLTEKILAQRDRIEGERKQVTVMFCDMEGFTPLVEKLGPEEAYALLDKVLEILIHKVHDYEGTVNKMTGDGIMALFGAPIALEDAPQRAIRSAHAIHREMVKFTDRLKQEFAKGVEYFDKSLEMSKAADNPLGISSVKSTVTGINYIVQAKIDLALKTSQESLRVAEKVGDVYAQGLAYSSYGLSSYLRGDFDQAESFLLKGLAVLERISQSVWSAWNASWLSWFYMERADYEKTRDYSIRARSILLDNGGFSPSLMNMFTVSCVRSEALSQKRDINVSDLIKLYEKNRLKILEGIMARYIGETFTNMDGKYSHEAESWLRKAIEADNQNGTNWFLAGDYVSYSEMYKRRGKLPEAREHMGKAIEIFKNCGPTGGWKNIRKNWPHFHKKIPS